MSASRRLTAVQRVRCDSWVMGTCVTRWVGHGVRFVALSVEHGDGGAQVVGLAQVSYRGSGHRLAPVACRFPPARPGKRGGRAASRTPRRGQALRAASEGRGGEGRSRLVLGVRGFRAAGGSVPRDEFVLALRMSGNRDGWFWLGLGGGDPHPRPLPRGKRGSADGWVAMPWESVWMSRLRRRAGCHPKGGLADRCGRLLLR